ncbi:MAG TPA: pyridoxamine 5'-phosphate oxidase [Tianweitania sediminis]|nr:pyridoxamine 5'-phosphate oxidase [Tianweitania sediminis]
MDETTLTSGDFAAAQNPFHLFGTWLAEAAVSEINDPNAVAVATVDANGLPNVRMVLLKDFDEAGFVFYTNYESAKGREVQSNWKAAMVFHWKSLRRQVRLRGPVESVTASEADTYFASRPRGSRIAAWASQQSRPLESKEALEREVARYEEQFGNGEIPRPPHWSGFRIVPETIEFWHDRPYRLHERIVFSRAASGWSKQRLNP